jgi:hypothetical protein
VRRLAAAVLAAVLVAEGLPTAHEACAQVRWDAEAAAGGAGRVLASRPSGGGAASAGPVFDVAAHLALVPLVRVGLYAHEEASPLSSEGARTLRGGGVDARLAIPWLRGAVRGYLRFGLGEIAVSSSPHRVWAVPGVVATSAAGSFTEVPVGIGALYRLDRLLWLSAEVGARVGFAFGGRAYGGTSSNGTDVAALSLELGVMWGR